MRNHLLIIGVTSGIMVACLKNFLEKKYKIFATYSNEKSLSNIPNNLRKSKSIRFIKLNLMEENEKILRIIKKNKVKADIIINAVGGSFGIKGYPYDLDSWQKSLNLNILKHILINNFFLKKMVNQKFGRILFFSTQAVDDPSASISYSTSKAFLENYVKKSSIFFGKYNVLINCIRTSIVAAKNNNWYKGTVSKPQKVNKLVKKHIAVEKIGKVEDLIDFINLVISSKNNFMNGSVVRIDGGIK
jgi:NAD(P)-dependent dehydrogenase (short-subunit alcohol dehydrogenase family)